LTSSLCASYWHACCSLVVSLCGILCRYMHPRKHQWQLCALPKHSSSAHSSASAGSQDHLCGRTAAAAAAAVAPQAVHKLPAPAQQAVLLRAART
jgi:hypothetical protein